MTKGELFDVIDTLKRAMGEVDPEGHGHLRAALGHLYQVVGFDDAIKWAAYHDDGRESSPEFIAFLRGKEVR